MTNRNISSFFTLLLLVSSVTTHSEFSWQNTKEWTQGFLNIDKETAEKIMPAAIFVGGSLFAAGLLYWMSQKNNNRTIATNNTPADLIPFNAVLATKPNLIQLDVYSQSNGDGGGGASCGYQTALRSMQVVNGLGKNRDMDELKATLVDSGAIQKYFGKDGTWRKAIIQKRTEDKFKESLSSRLWQAFKKDLDEKDMYEKEFKGEFKTYDDFNGKVQGLYKSALGFIENWMLEIARIKEIEKSFDLTDDALRGYISKGLLNLQNDKNKNLIDLLSQERTIDSYFDYQLIRKNLFSDNWILDLQTLWKDVSEKFTRTQDANGEWLSDGEVEYIWNHHKKDIITSDDAFPKIKCGFQTISNFENIGQEGFDEVTPEIEQSLKPKINKKEQIFYIFALGTMRQSGDTQRTRGHWYPLVMHQNWDGNRTYYVTDSMNNNVRTNDVNVWKIINIIEQ